jgi:hypothetical protein
VDDFMRRPTEVFESYMALEYGVPRGWYKYGRLSMALEILTVMRLLDEHSGIVAHAQETISVLQTLLVDQDLFDDASMWYEKLSEWRRPKFYVVGDPDADASALEAPHRTLPPHDSTDAQPGSDQTKDPPLSG